MAAPDTRSEGHYREHMAQLLLVADACTNVRLTADIRNHVYVNKSTSVVMPVV